MFAMGKMKVKVYFYHLFILTVVMLLCFFLMYRDMKRIESNMLNLYQRCNNLDKLLTSTTETSSAPVPNNMLDNIEKLEENIQNVYENDSFNAEDNNVNNNVVVNDNDDTNDNDGKEDESDNVEIENIEIENSSDSDNENDDEENLQNQNDDSEVRELLQKVIMVNDETDDVEDLLNSIDNEDKDLSKLEESELLTKTNNELKEYLKRTGKSTSGNKEQLVKNILGV